MDTEGSHSPAWVPGWDLSEQADQGESGWTQKGRTAQSGCPDGISASRQIRVKVDGHRMAAQPSVDTRISASRQIRVKVDGHRRVAQPSVGARISASRQIRVKVDGHRRVAQPSVGARMPDEGHV